MALLKTFNYIGDHSGCHQLPERSFCVKGYIFPICARCTGVFGGQLLALILFAFGISTNIYLCVVALLIMGLDWFIQYIGFRQLNNIRRLITGFLGGLGVFGIYINIFIKIINFFF